MSSKNMIWCDLCEDEISEGGKSFDVNGQPVCETCKNIWSEFLKFAKPEDVNRVVLNDYLYERYCIHCEDESHCGLLYSDSINCPKIRDKFEVQEGKS